MCVCEKEGGYTCTVVFGPAVVTVQGMYHMLVRTKAQSGGVFVKEEITPPPHLSLFHIKVKGLILKGDLNKHFSLPKLEHNL